MPSINSHYHRKGFGLEQQVQSELQQAYESDLITELKKNGNTLIRANTTIKLAEAFGFCWGVDRAVSMAYEARRHFPRHRIWITNEIIHNPVVNKNLRDMKINFIPTGQDGGKDLRGIDEGDVVILPAFGASLEEMRLLESKSCEIVDTTCPWVSRVWNRIAKYEDQDFTAIIHGKYNHEETVATSSRSKNYLIVQNLSEAQSVCNYIIGRLGREEFLNAFRQAHSEGFNPDVHLKRVGIANQTTMLKGETERIGKLLERTMLEKYGPERLNEHFLSPGDTICNATQERQDAILKLVKERLDLTLVIGGYNSSNTGHLQEIAIEHGLHSYHIDGPNSIGPGNMLTHKRLNHADTTTVSPWLTGSQLTIGITAGASTPDQVVSDVIEKILEIRGCS